MRLALSSAAAPDLALADLLAGCQRRGLAGLELAAGGAHGVDSWIGRDAARDALRALERAGVELTALALPDDEPPEYWLRLARWLEAPALLDAAARPAEEVAALLDRHAAAGGRALLRHDTDPAAAEAARRLAEGAPAGSAALAWEVDPAGDDPALFGAVLRAAGPALRYLRLRGGGPESAEQGGLGVGPLMARLALARFSGPLVLLPGKRQYHYAWRAWLGRAGGWGCGSKGQDSGLFALSTSGNRAQ